MDAPTVSKVIELRQLEKREAGLLTGKKCIGPHMMRYICETKKGTDSKYIHAPRCRQEGLGSSSSLTEQPRRQEGRAVVWFTLKAPTRTQKIGRRGITNINRTCQCTIDEGDKGPMNIEKAAAVQLFTGFSRAPTHDKFIRNVSPRSFDILQWVIDSWTRPTIIHEQLPYIYIYISVYGGGLRTPLKFPP